MQKVLMFIVFLTLFDVFFVGLGLLEVEEESNFEELKVDELEMDEAK
jgi:hypothetical protein